MKIKTTKLFTFDELSEEAKAKSIEANRDINVEHWCWWHSVEDMFKEDMAKLGYTVEKIYFSGFNSQGDGACFEGDVEVADWLKAHKLANKYRALYSYVSQNGGSVNIAQVGHYYHERSMAFDENNSFYYEAESDSKAVTQMTEVMELIENEAEEKARQLYKDLEAESDYLMSDEVIADVLLTNEYDFLAEGGQIQ